MNQNEYKQLVHKHTPKSPIITDCLKAFIFGGGICCFGELLKLLYSKAGLTENALKLAISATLIIITAILTGLGVFDKIARHAGAGTAVPITGFANSMVASAIEFKTEGLILGTGAKTFTLAGPVIVYGTIASAIYGFIYWVMGIL